MATHWASSPVNAQGAPAGSALDISELYDPGTGKWTITDSLHTARYVHAATLLQNGCVLVTGGLSGKGNGDALASAELYNPLTRVWTETASLPNEMINHTSTLLPNGKVLVVSGQRQGVMSSDAELYDPSKGT
ncbi:MAG: hypothetical protein LV479_11710 [Methylacidiphilales bacterium]|nr:hypothetical protein [Candidatus Methylacidiphilales bacterium]